MGARRRKARKFDPAQLCLCPHCSAQEQSEQRGEIEQGSGSGHQSAVQGRRQQNNIFRHTNNLTRNGAGSWVPTQRWIARSHGKAFGDFNLIHLDASCTKYEPVGVRAVGESRRQDPSLSTDRAVLAFLLSAGQDSAE
ncbi:hypothetical protein C8R44DRAFT_724222 [Mycena epipterygia]|nr:hypothetical protein C8R44DRAFT_724222 [Mycena epipterygia]